MARRKETEVELWCGACRAMHPKSCFGQDKNSHSGFAYTCKKVVSQRNKSYHLCHRSAINRRNKERRLERKQSQNSQEWALKKLLSDAQRRASKKGIEFTLSLVDLPTPKFCPVFGWQLIYQATGHRRPQSASLDRIDSQGGYTPDNVWIISWRANHIKSDATVEELYAVATSLERRLIDGNIVHVPLGRKDAGNNRSCRIGNVEFIKRGAVIRRDGSCGIHNVSVSRYRFRRIITGIVRSG